jgi:predicted permease
MSNSDLRLFPGGRGADAVDRSIQQALLVLGGVAAIVLLIACVNIANLMQARAAARQKEMAIRMALGSGRWRLARAALMESAALTLCGGTFGLLLGSWGGRTLITILPPSGASSKGRTALDVPLDWRLLFITIVLSAAAAILFTAIPILRLARSHAAPGMKQVAAESDMSRLRGASILMAAQVAISAPLLVGAVLFLQTVYNLGKVELGFNPDHLTIFRLDPSLNGYDPNRIERLYSDVIQRLQAIAGVTSATVNDLTLMSHLQNNWTFIVDGGETKNVKFIRVGPSYFDTYSIPLVVGRSIGIQDHSGVPGAAIVNEMAARTLFGGSSARPSLDDEIRSSCRLRVAGVVKDSRYTSQRDPMPPTIYLPYAQTALGRLGPMNVTVRSALPAAAMPELIRAAVADVSLDLPVIDLKTQTEQMNQAMGPERTFMRLLIVFGAFALLLASIGLHGVTSYSVTRRTSEIGVRVALGAQRWDVLWLVLRQVAIITSVGLCVGVPSSIALARLVRSLLYGVQPADPLSVAASAVVMAGIAGLAGFLPARRAARLDPLKALRYE